MSSAFPSPPDRRRWPLVAFTLLVVTVVGAFAAYWFWPRPAADTMTAALAANTRGVGWMEHFEFAKAETEFAEAARLAPTWTPARVNLAISLFNQDQTQNPGKLDRARAIFNDILKADPRNTHAHYCLGVLDSERGAVADAHKHFLAVKEADPADAHTWYRLGMTHPDGTRSDGAKARFEEALKRNPYLNAARYNLAQILFATDVPAAEKMAAENTRLREATWETEVATKYSIMGKYADVIGRDPAATPPQPVGPVPLFAGPPAFGVAFLPGHSWAAPGGPVTLFDFNGDGRPDVFVSRSVSDGKGAKNALLRNDANGTYSQVALPPAAADHGGPAVAGDLDNDGHPDLLLVGPKQLLLLRNTGKDAFEDVTDAAGLGKLDGAFAAARWLDIDQDSDLDLVVAQGAAGVVVFENVGEAQPGKTALTVKFRRLAAGLPNTPASAFVTTDIDRDGDTDLLLLADGAAPTPVLNDRLMRFRAGPPLPGVGAAKWLGGVTLDANRDERSDLVLLRAGEPPVVLLSKGEAEFTPGATNSPPLAHAVAVDLDLDGWPDVVGLDAAGKPVFLHNTGDGKLAVVPDAFGAAEQLPAASHALAVADLDGDGNLDLLLVGADGLRVRRSQGNGNRGVFVSPTGRRDKGDDRRTNADGIGCWLAAQTGGHFTCADRLATESGAGQSLLPTVLGLGRHERADALRVRWPDAVVQAEIGVAAGPYRLTETNRKGTSCPVLVTWDGERFVFVTDFLGGGALGESGPDGSIRPPRPEESVKIEAHQLRPRDGQYVLKVAEPMDEVLYLDRLRLDVVDHPKGVVVYPDERFVLAPPFPTQEMLAFRERHVPKAAVDERGRDVLPLLRDRDSRAVNTFAVRSWLGYAADHALTLDFGAVPSAPGRRWNLVLAGWTEYPYPESMYAATRAGVALHPPVLERLAADGATWEPVCDLGFPAGLTRVMTRELPGFAPSGKTVLRVRTNMQVYWDHVFLAPAEELAATARVTALEPHGASLAARGFMREVTPYPGGPVGYDDERTEPVAVTRWKGNLTRLGDVTELLTAADDRFVLCGPGDEITARFDATRLPPLPDGWERSFVLRTWGYCKDTSTTTASGGRVGPLPFRAMPNYPDFGGDPTRHRRRPMAHPPGRRPLTGVATGVHQLRPSPRPVGAVHMRSYLLAAVSLIATVATAPGQPRGAGRDLGPFPGQVAEIHPSPDGRHLLLTAVRPNVGYVAQVWDVKSGEQRGSTEDPAFLRGVFTADGKGVVLLRKTAGGAATVQTWDFLAGPPGELVPLPGVTGTVYLAPGGKAATTVVRATKDSPVEVAGWTLEPPAKTWTRELDPLKLAEVRAVPGGPVYLVHKVDDPRNPCKLLVLDPKTGKTTKAELPGLITPGMSEDGKLYTDSPGGGFVVALDASGKTKWTTPNLPNATFVHIHGKHVAVKFQGSGELAVLDAANGKLLRKLDLNPERPGATAVSADGKTLYVAVVREAAGERRGFVRSFPIAGK